MKTIILAIAAILPTVSAVGQTTTELQKTAADIVSKAKLIYDLEFAAWLANDTVLSNSGFDKKAIESYVSYKSAEQTVCVFYSRTDMILAEFIFEDNSISKISYNERICNPDELRLIKIKRTIADKILKKEIKKFKVEPNTTYNFVPVILGNDNFCYLINAVSDKTKTILGRDCKIKLDVNFDIVETVYNHKTIQQLPFDIEGIKAFYHTHILDDFFSETELATTMLYKKYLPTDQFIVMGKKYTSVWNSTTGVLTIN